MDYSNDYSEDDSTDEIARLGYLKWDPKFDLVYGTEKPYEMNMERPEWFPRTNMEMELGPEEKIHDIRTAKRTFSLDDNGFAYRHDPLATKNWDKLTVEREYLPSVERMMQAEFGDEAIVKIFQWRVRLVQLWNSSQLIVEVTFKRSIQDRISCWQSSPC
jgi:hypothetical protein